MHGRRRSLLAPAALALLAGLPAAAQEAAPPDEIEQAERVMPRPRPEAQPIMPTVPPGVKAPQPGLTGGAAWGDEAGADPVAPQAPQRLPEGASIIKRPGRVLTAPSGHRVFVIDRDRREPGEGPMLLLPCRTLARLDASLAGSADEAVVVSGFVYEYAGRNYLLPTAFARASAAELEAALGPADRPAGPADPGITDAEPADLPAGQPTDASLADDPDVAELMDELTESPGLRAIAPPAPEVSGRAPAPQPEAADDGGFIPDGTPVTRRRSRLVRLAAGEWAVRFDNDTDTAPSAAALDEPLTVLPCRLLEKTEPLAMTEGDGLELLVSGRVYTYGNRRYILPTIFQRPLKIGIDPMQ